MKPLIITLRYLFALPSELVRHSIRPRFFFRYIIPYAIGTLSFLILFSGMYFVQRRASALFVPNTLLPIDNLLSIQEILFFSAIIFSNLLSGGVMLIVGKRSLMRYLSQSGLFQSSKAIEIWVPGLRETKTSLAYSILGVIFGVSLAVAFQSATVFALTLVAGLSFFYMHYLIILTETGPTQPISPWQLPKNWRLLILLAVFILCSIAPLLPILLVPILCKASLSLTFSENTHSSINS